MNALVRLFARMSQRAPIIVIVVMVGLTALFGSFAGQSEVDQSQESFSPDNAELTALEFSGEVFQGSSETLVQVLVQGDDVVSPAGLEAVAAVRDAITADVPGEWLGTDDAQGPIVSYLAPLEAAAAQGQIDPASLTSDAAVDRAFTQTFEQLPEEISGLSTQLIAAEDDLANAETALMLVFLDTDAIVGDATGDAATTALVDAVETVNQAVTGVESQLNLNGFAFELFFEPDESFNTEVARLFGIAALVIVVILFVIYLVSPRGSTSWLGALRRGAADTGLTLFAILASITWMQGLGVLLGPDYLNLIGGFNPTTQIIPILLIGLGVDYAIHLTTRYREEVSSGAEVDAAAGGALRTVGIALVLATITTALGFLTNLVNPVPAIADFGILSALGIIAAFLMMMTVVPSVRILLDRRAEKKNRLPRESLSSSSESRLSTTMAKTSLLAERAPAAVLTVTLLAAGAGAYGLTELDTEFSFADFVPDGSELKETFVTIEDEFGGGFGERTTVLMRGDVATPEVHNATVASLQNLSDTGGVITFGDQAAATSPVSVLGQVLAAAQPDGPGGAEGPAGAAPGGETAPDGAAPGGETAPDAAAPSGETRGAGGGQPAGEGAGLPAEPAAITAFAQLAQASGLQPDLTFAADADVAEVYSQLLDLVPEQAGAVLARNDGGEFIASQASVQSQSSEVGATELQQGVLDDFAPVTDTGIEVVPTSNEIVSAVIVNELSASQVTSLAVTLTAALLLLVAVFWVRESRPELGVITILPVALVVLWVFGTMAATGIPFGPVTATISALAIGIGVPFTIHIAHRFMEDLQREVDLESALRSTMRNTGGALAGSAFTTMAGFAVLISSSLPPFRQLGLVVAYAIGYSLLAAVIVLPSVLALWARWRHVDPSPAERAESEPVSV